LKEIVYEAQIPEYIDSKRIYPKLLGRNISSMEPKYRDKEE